MKLSSPNAVSPRTGRLRNGDRLEQAEFHRRYLAAPPETRAELIGGVVHIQSPVGIEHARYHLDLSGLLCLYRLHTPGVEASVDPTVILGGRSEPQPDLVLRIVSELRGRSRFTPDNFLAGAPELMVEIAHSTVSIDLGRKKADYRTAGVLEYLVLCVEERELFWFHFPSRRKLRPDRQGIWRSKEFPGLWIDGPALIERRSARCAEVLQQGLATPEHAAFVAQLKTGKAP